MIEKQKLEKFIENNLSQRQIANQLECSQGQVRHWLKKYNLSTNPTWKLACHTNFFNIRCNICNKQIFKNIRNRSLCPSCVVKIRRTRVKLTAVKYLGSKCSHCGLDAKENISNIAALEFHHLNSKEKDFTISSISNRSWKVIKKELKKCQLLCSNCHRKLHSDREDEIFLKYVSNYQGNFLDFD